MQINRNSHLWLGEYKMVPLWKTVWWFLIKPNILLPYNSTLSCLGIYLEELKTYAPTIACSWMFIADLLIMPKLGRNQDVFH
jgi:hypothetical protein